MEAFLKSRGAEISRTKGSHAAWRLAGCPRPAIVDLSLDELPDLHVRRILAALNLKTEDLRDYLRR